MPTFVALLFAYTLSQFYRSFLAVVAGDVARDLGLDVADLGSLSAIWFAGFALASLPVGYGLDTAGPRRTLCIGMTAAVAGAAMFALAPSRAWALAGMALIGVGSSPVLMSSMYVFARDYPTERFAILSSTAIALGSLGNLAGGTPLAWAAARFGWRMSLLTIAGLTAIAIAVAWLTLRDQSPDRAAKAAGPGLGSLLRLRAIWLLMPLACISYAVVIATRSLWIAPFLSSVQGLEPAALGHAALAMALAMSLGSLAYGPLERLLGHKNTVMGGTALCGLAFLALGFVGGASFGLALMLLVAIGFFGLTYAILMAHARVFMAPALVGRGVTFMNVGFIGGAGILQWLSGHAVQASLDAGLGPDVVYARLFLTYGVMLLAALAVYVFAPARPLEPVTRTAPSR